MKKTACLAAVVSVIGVSAEYCDFGYGTEYCQDGCCYSEYKCCSNNSNAVLWGSLGGTLAFIVIVIVITVYCCKRRQANPGLIRSPAQQSTVVNTNGTSIQVQNQPVHAAGGVITVSGGQVFTTPNTSPVISTTAPSNQVVFANNPANYTNQAFVPNTNVAFQQASPSIVNPPIINANPIQARTPAQFQRPSAGQRIAAGMTRAIVSGAVQGAMQGFIGN